MANFLTTLEKSDTQWVRISLQDLQEAADILAERVAQKLGAARVSHDELMSSDDVARQLGVSKMTLWRWDRIGYLNSIKVGRQRRYRRQDIVKLLNFQKS